MRTLAGLLVIILIISLSSNAFIEQQTQSGGLPAEYLSFFSVSSRSLGMGDAYTSLANEASGTYYNPAAGANLGKQQIDFMYTPVLGGNYFSMFYIYSPSLKYSVGTGLISLQSDDAEKRNEWGQYEGKFNDVRRALYASGAMALNENVNLGVNLKFLYQSLDEYSGSGFGTDIGIKYIPSEKFALGSSLQNIISKGVKLKKVTEKIPLNIKNGISLKFFNSKLLLSADFSIFDVGGQTNFRWAAGTEYNIYKILYIRGGINYKNLTAGFGIILDKFIFSYGTRYSSAGLFHSLGTAYKFSMLQSAKEKELEKRKRMLQVKESRFEEWKLKEKEKFMKKLNKSYSMLEDKLADTERKNKELEALIQAALAMNKGNFDEAEKALNEILSRNPDNDDANMLLGIIQEELSRDFSFSRLMKAYNSGEYAKALAESEKADPKHPQYVQAKIIGLLSKARINILEGKYGEAIENLNKVIDIRPDNEIAKVLLRKAERLKELNNEKF